MSDAHDDFYSGYRYTVVLRAERDLALKQRDYNAEVIAQRNEMGSRDFHAIERLVADRDAMTASRDKAMRMFKAALAGQDRWVPCMDHRDKVDYRVSGCPQCQIEKAATKENVK